MLQNDPLKRVTRLKVHIYFNLVLENMSEQNSAFKDCKL